ncbi:MAG: sensor histidine kinase [Bacteroidota bacterium]|nr:sensor histidine kinase [Bacteroidota bacterium]MDP3146511.1 sensor histidine kinase [Bacteroidota bacterium]
MIRPCHALKLLLVIQFMSNVSLKAQNKKLDSLNLVLKNAKHDTTRAYTYVALTEILYTTNPDTLLPLCNKALSIIEKNIASAHAKEKRSYLFTKAAALNNIGFVYHLRGQIPTAINYFKKGLKINEELNVPKEIANSLSNLGAIYDQQAQPGQALEYLIRALEIQKKIGAKEGMAYSLNNISAIYQRQGQTEKTLETLHESLKLQEEQGNKHGVATALNNLGALYSQIGHNNEALDYYNKSLKIRENLNDLQGIATCLHNIGYIYETRNNRKLALDFNFRGLKIFQEIGDTRGVANLFHNIAAIYEKEGDLKEAVKYYHRAITIHDSTGDKRGLSNSLNNMGLTLLKMGNPKKGREYTVKGLEAAIKGRYVESIRASYFGLSKIDSALGNYAVSLANFKTFIKYRDSVSNEQTKKAAIKKQLQYDYEKKEGAMKLRQEKKDALQLAEMKRQNLINWVVVIAGALLLLISFLLFNRYSLKQRNKFQLELTRRQKQQADAVIDTQESERKRIAEDIHDSLGHLLSTIKLNIQTINSNENQVLASINLLNQASEEIRNITFNLMPQTLEEGGLVLALKELVTKLTLSGIVKVNLHVHNLEKFVLEKQSQFNIYRIIQEAVNNILKHADASEINIQLIGLDGHISIMIEDDGKGFTVGKKNTGRGLKNIVTRSLWLKGSLNIDSTPGKGTTITSEIPV